VTIEEIYLPNASGHEEMSWEGHCLKLGTGSSTLEAEAKALENEWESAAASELKLARRLCHPNLVQYFGSVFNAEMGILQLLSEPPLVPLGVALRMDSDQRLNKGGYRLGLLLDVAHAVEFLHRRGVVHRCISMQHVFLRDSTAELGAKLGGLLAARVVHRVTRQESHTKVAVVRATALVQLREDLVEPRSADMCAFGELAKQLFAGSDEADDRTDKMRNRLSLVTFAALRMVILKCMDKNHMYRLSASQVVRAIRLIRDGHTVAWVDDIPNDPSKITPLVDDDLTEDDLSVV